MFGVPTLDPWRMEIVWACGAPPGVPIAVLLRLKKRVEGNLRSVRVIHSSLTLSVSPFRVVTLADDARALPRPSNKT